MIKRHHCHETVAEELFIVYIKESKLSVSCSSPLQRGNMFYLHLLWHILKLICCGDAGRGWCLLYFSENSSLITSGTLWLRDCFKERLLCWEAWGSREAPEAWKRASTHAKCTHNYAHRMALTFDLSLIPEKLNALTQNSFHKHIYKHQHNLLCCRTCRCPWTIHNISLWINNWMAVLIYYWFLCWPDITQSFIRDMFILYK